MNKTLLALTVATSIAVPGIAYTERNGYKDDVDLILKSSKTTHEMISKMLYVSFNYPELQSGHESKKEIYDCLQNIPEECYKK